MWQTFRGKKTGWQGPFRLIAVNGTGCTVDLTRGPRTFRSTVVKPYYTDTIEEPSPEGSLEIPPENNGDDEDEPAATPVDDVRDTNVVNPKQPPRRKCGIASRWDNSAEFTKNTVTCELTLEMHRRPGNDEMGQEDTEAV
ncbi:hypothetical protein LZ31DRAFT_596376 [Colletotrichum somersetense]|nr:hypothetical protein LZ31DRAFT_596376 [Colletotrichum somersetense]